MDVTPSKPAGIGFELSISARDDATLEAVYVKIRDDTVATTREVIEGTLLADYSASGELIGIEILGPVRFSDLEALVEQAQRANLRRFLEKTAPRELIAA